MDEVLTRVLLDQANKGNKGDGDWKVQAFQAVVDEIRILLGTTVTKGNVKNRLRNWKQHYGDHPDARAYANKEIKNWDNIVLLCGKDRVVGSHVENIEDAVGAMSREDDDVRSISSFESGGVGGSKAKRDDDDNSGSSKRSKKDKVGDALVMVVNSLKSYFEIKSNKEEKRHSTKQIYEVLCDIPGLTRSEIAKAVIKYNNYDPGQFNLLLDIPSDERKLFVDCFLSES
ncbi:hypothetical protein LINGRAHAP2_LOCUS7565 [Linum grandiflorum]